MRRIGKTRWLGMAAVAALLGALGIGALGVRAQMGEVLKAESERVAVVKKVTPAVVAVFANGGQGGGTGVLISEDGFALTNFHVVQGSGPLMQCGLPDGVLYNAVLVGLDKVGDVALIKLYAKKEGHKFPYAPMGDSSLVKEGDWSLAMGNPFLLATDFHPTVTFGLVSGVHRYQYPEGTFLEYPDCIQIDTSINPGNSGGPLFNMKGELIGINGRGSFDKRGRINSGVGYAISINQIKNFLGHLRAGIEADHASLGAIVESDPDNFGRMRVTRILEDCDAARRGLDLDDELVAFAGRYMGSVNQYKNALGVHPRGWRVPLEYRHEGVRREVLVRLMGVQAKEIKDGGPQPPPAKRPVPIGKGAGSPLAKFYQPKPGFANAYFNKLETERLWSAFQKQGDFKSLGGKWTIDGEVSFKRARATSPVHIEIAEEKGKDGKGAEPVVRMRVGEFPYKLYPLQPKLALPELRVPESSGGLLLALHLYKDLLVRGDSAFKRQFTHGGYAPIYPPLLQGQPKSLNDLRVDAELLNTVEDPFVAKWFFSRTDHKLLGVEVQPTDPNLFQENDERDPCEVYFSDYRQVDGRQLPHRMQVVFGNSYYGTFTFKSFKFAK